MPDPPGEFALDQVAAGTLARVLATTDGAVATILEQYAGEPVRAVKLSQAFEAADSQMPELPFEEGEKVLHQSIVLRGSRSRANYLYGEGVIRAERLPPDVLEEIFSSGTPLRRILADHRVGTFREMTGVHLEPAGACAGHFGVPPDAPVISRRYRVLIDEEPVIAICEKFPLEPYL